MRDGDLYGRLGRIELKPGQSLEDAPAILPRGRPPSREVVLFVNGAGSSGRRAKTEAQALADATGLRVVGLYNETQGIGRDIWEFVRDELGVGRPNAATAALATHLWSRLISSPPRPTRVCGYSQGGAIVAHALERVRGKFRRLGWDEGQIRRRLAHVQVVTYATAGGQVGPGPRSTHFVNTRDLVPTWVGVDSFLRRLAARGPAEPIYRFTVGPPLSSPSPRRFMDLSREAHQLRKYLTVREHALDQHGRTADETR